MTPPTGGQVAAAIWLGLCLALVFGLPGLVALDAAGQRARGVERAALAVGASVTLWPLVLLWTTVVGFAWTAARYRLAMLVLVAIAGYRLARQARASRAAGRGGPAGLRRGMRAQPWTLALAVILGLAVILRIVQVQGVVAPPWVDGYHHTLITQLIVERGGVPADYRPYLAVDLFYYHFGFHALAAAVAWLSGAPAATAVLWTGQALNVLTVLTVYLLARRLLETPAAAVLAAAVPSAWFWFPSYFVTWGRYTQLAGLVALPVVWVLVADAIAWRRPVRGQLLAAACAAGLLLVHYRVFVFYLIGIGLVALYVVLARRRPRGHLLRLAAIGVAGGVLVSPWLAQSFAGGVAALAAASPTWYRGSVETVDAVSQVPEWLFTQGTNEWWIGLAIAGTLAGLARRRWAALGLAAWLALAYLAVRPGPLGLSTSWMLPPFALVISLYIPVAIGVGLLGDAVAAVARSPVWAGRRRTREPSGPPGEAAAIAVGDAGVNSAKWQARLGALGALAVVGLGLAGAWQIRAVINPATIIVQAADVAAADWVRAHTPPGARFLVAVTHWHLGTYRGLDGGYWLPILAGRETNMPAALYTYGDPAEVRAVNAVAEIAAKGDALGDDEIDALLDRTGAAYIYVGPAAAGQPGKLSAERLARHPGLEELYGRDGVHIFGRKGRAP